MGLNLAHNGWQTGDTRTQPCAGKGARGNCIKMSDLLLLELVRSAGRSASKQKKKKKQNRVKAKKKDKEKEALLIKPFCKWKRFLFHQVDEYKTEL